MLPLLAPPTTWRSFSPSIIWLLCGPCLCPSSASSIAVFSRCAIVTTSEVEGQWNLLLIAIGADLKFTGGNFIRRHWLCSKTMQRPIWKLGWVALPIPPICSFPSTWRLIIHRRLILRPGRAYYVINSSDLQQDIFCFVNSRCEL